MIHDAVKVAYSSIVGQSIMLSNAEAHALLDLATEAQNEGLSAMSSQTSKAADRAIDALGAAINTSARRAGFFE